MTTLHPLDRRLCHPKSGFLFSAGQREYRLEGKIGDGAVGLVRKASDLESRQLVAVKFLAPDAKYIEPSAFDDVAERFRREGQRGAALRHDNLVEILAYEDNVAGENFSKAELENPFIVMEYIHGRTAEAHIRKRAGGRNPRPQITRLTLHIALSVARALTHLHERKIVHRDVKPANIFLSKRTGGLPLVKLGDFGVTKWGDFLAAATMGTLTMSHQQGLGTFKYMSPEQAIRPKDVNVRSDMFSFGVTLYELFTSQLLPSPHHVFEIMNARSMRTNITGKLLALNLPYMNRFEESILEDVLTLFYQSPDRRPASKQMVGRLEFAFERFTGEPDDF